MIAGATHYTETYGIINYYRRMMLSEGIVGENNPIYSWFWWNGKTWIPESGLRNLQLIEANSKLKA